MHLILGEVCAFSAHFILSALEYIFGVRTRMSERMRKTFWDAQAHFFSVMDCPRILFRGSHLYLFMASLVHVIWECTGNANVLRPSFLKFVHQELNVSTLRGSAESVRGNFININQAIKHKK